MRESSLSPPQMGGAGKVVEIDETYIGRNQLYKNFKNVRGFQHKHVILTLAQRNGKARSFHVERSSAREIIPVVKENIAKETAVATDEANYYYYRLGEHFAAQGTVNHKEIRLAYVPSRRMAPWGRAHQHRRGLFQHLQARHEGRYQHFSERHLHRYRQSSTSHLVKLGVNDEARAAAAVAGVKGKRLTYRTTGERAQRD